MRIRIEGMVRVQRRSPGVGKNTEMSTSCVTEVRSMVDLKAARRAASWPESAHGTHSARALSHSIAAAIVIEQKSWKVISYYFSRIMTRATDWRDPWDGMRDGNSTDAGGMQLKIRSIVRAAALRRHRFDRCRHDAGGRIAVFCSWDGINTALVRLT